MIPLNERISGQKHKIIYEILRKQDTVSKIDLLIQSQLSVSTLTRTLDELCDVGLILEAGYGESTGGRRPILYRTNATYGYLFGLEISRTFSMIILCDMHMNKLESRRWPMNEGMTPEALVEEIVYSIRSMMAVHGITVPSVLGMGIGAVGPLDRFTGTMIDPLYFPANGWKNVQICEMFERKLGFPVLLDNGANMAIVGEHWAARNEEYQHLLYIHLGVGIRSAMMTGGKVVYGAVDMEGSIGQMIIQTNGPRLRDSGNFGNLETYASIYAIEQQARAMLMQGRQSLLLQQMMIVSREGTELTQNNSEQLQRHIEQVCFPQLVQAFIQQDSMAIELFTQAATYFGIGLSNMLNILHPEKVILGGPLVNFHPMWFETSTQVAIQNTHYYPSYPVKFSLGKLGQDALVTGAAVVVINHMTMYN